MHHRLCSLTLLLPLLASAAPPVQIGTGYSLPPYAITETARGLELDIVRAAFKEAGLDIHVNFLPPARTLLMLQNQQLDAITTVNEGIGKTNGFWSDSHISYQNYAITLQSSGLQINRIEDLAGHSIAAFQNASLSLGSQYQQAIRLAMSYKEYPNQLQQNKLLYSHRVDIVIADKLVFQYLTPTMGPGFDASQAVHYHDIFPPTPYKLLFATNDLRQRFNQGLNKIRRNGEYQLLISHYNKQP